MNTRPEAYTYGDITYNLPVELTNLTGLKIIQTIGDHVKIYLKGIAPDTLEPKDIEQVAAKAKIELTLPGRDVPYFAGVCTNISMMYQAGLKTVEIEGRSWTYEFDITKKSRSYQKLNISYDDLITDVLKNYAEKDFRINIPAQKYIHFAVQYRETDWEFLKRIAAREGTVLVAEYADPNHQPRFWLGLPKAASKSLTETAEKNTYRDNSKYQEIAQNHELDVKETDFITYETTGYEILYLGETVDYAGKELTVINVISQVDKGLLKNTYTLAYSDKMALAQPENVNLKSISLAGKVLERSGINVKMHLDIDEKQDKSTAIWFPYAADTNNLMYCMPHEDEDINLYFKDDYEENAIAISAARKNGGDCKKTGDYNNRYFTNHERKELYLSPDTISFTTDESAPEKITIKMTEQEGVIIESVKNVGMNAVLNLTLEADKDINIASVQGMFVICGESVISILDDVDMIGSRVEVIGRVKCNLPLLDMAMVKSALGDLKGVAMAALSMVPVVGQAIAVYDMYQAYKSGDTLGVAAAAIGLIPGGGVVGAVAKTVVCTGLQTASAMNSSSQAEA